jgi:hypothetical protein
MTHQEDSTTIAQAATGNGCAGLIAHLSWALHLDEAQAAKVAEIAAQWSDTSEGQYAFDRCESPAERLFLIGGRLCETIGIGWRGPTDDADGWWGNAVARVWREDEPPESRDDVQIIVQASLGTVSRRRPDFLFICRASPWNVILDVEIDGHDYHSTKEQLGDDHARDIDLLMLPGGIQTIRFTGSQVYANPVECFASALDVLDAMVMRQRRTARIALAAAAAVAGLRGAAE